MKTTPPFTAKQFFKYTLLPGFGSRISKLIGSGFGNLAYLIAYIYNTAGILPNNHEYLRTSSIGKFGIRHVIAEASQHVKFDRYHIDQVLIFSAILIGIVLLALQFVVLFFSILTNPAFAGGGWYTSFFETPYPEDDVAFRMMTLVFGVDMFGGALATQPIHVALYALFEFYSLGMLIVGTFIILYFATTIISETANTGIPFGKRFSHAWVPIRLIVFFGLLIPLPDGLNGAQWITLSVAKYGSSMATNGWIRFNSVISNPLGATGTLVATPNTPEVSHIPAFMMLAKTCQWAEGRKFGKEIDGYVIYGPEAGDSVSINGLAYVTALGLTSTNNDAPGGNLIVRFGEKDPVQYANQSGAVGADCGEIVFKTNDVGQPGALAIQSGYFELIKLLWANNGSVDAYARNFTFRHMSTMPREPNSPLPDAEYRGDIVVGLTNAAEQIILQGVAVQLAIADQGIDPEIARLGWGGAGIWYNRIAEQNGSITTAAMNTPTPQLYPRVMEFVRTEKMKNDRNIFPEDRFNPRLSNGDVISFDTIGDSDIARVLNIVFQNWEGNDTRTDDKHTQAMGDTGNVFINAINAILGTEGLFDMCRNTDIHPLAQLSAVGKGMIEAAINNLAISAGFGLLGGTGLIPGGVGASVDSLSGFFGTMASLGLMVGFVLFYVLPFLPFIYFFFAVGGWVKSVFEAMVGVPLWALAHLRIDGDGLPGQAATAGYMLLFEIFMRPIAIIFGLLAAIVIFAAQVKVLNEIFYLAVSSFGGADPDTMTGGGCTTGPLSGLGRDVLGELPGSEKYTRNAIDEFFFTIIYAVIVYMMAMASFKLIDLLPNSLVSRWYGTNASSFTDDNEPSRGAENLMKYSTIGGGMVGSQLSEAVGSVQQSWQQAGPEAARRAAMEVNQLATDPALLPAHIQTESDLASRMRSRFEQAGYDDPRSANYIDDDAERQAAKQQLFEGEFRNNLITARNKQDAITSRITELGGQGMTAASQAEYQRNTQQLTATRDQTRQFLEGHGITFNDRN